MVLFVYLMLSQILLTLNIGSSAVLSLSAIGAFPVCIRVCVSLDERRLTSRKPRSTSTRFDLAQVLCIFSIFVACAYCVDCSRKPSCVTYHVTSPNYLRHQPGES